MHFLAGMAHSLGAVPDNQRAGLLHANCACSTHLHGRAWECLREAFRTASVVVWLWQRRVLTITSPGLTPSSHLDDCVEPWISGLATGGSGNHAHVPAQRQRGPRRTVAREVPPASVRRRNGRHCSLARRLPSVCLCLQWSVGVRRASVSVYSGPWRSLAAPPACVCCGPSSLCMAAIRHPPRGGVGAMAFPPSLINQSYI